ncbi:hypothetical protein ACL598_22735 [Bordetella bronchialis]|uniref:hypothetical protein n=1 Tax=Bordetella bronchialis TaxID=463025 RepID=UPI003D080B11
MHREQFRPRPIERATPPRTTLLASAPLAVILWACTSAAAQASGAGTVTWRNLVNAPLKVMWDAHNDCVTNPGMKTFDVVQDQTLPLPLNIKSGCDAYIRWTATQDRMTLGKTVATISYTERAGTEALVTIRYTTLPQNVRSLDYRAACGTKAENCRNRLVPLPDGKTRVSILVPTLPAEFSVLLVSLRNRKSR